MAYNKTVYVNNTTPAISAENLNKVENELEYLDSLSEGNIYNGTLTFTAGLIAANGNIGSPTENKEVYTNKIYSPKRLKVTITFSTSQALWLAMAEYKADDSSNGRTILIQTTNTTKSATANIKPDTAYIRLCFRTFNLAYTLDTNIFLDSNKIIDLSQNIDSKVTSLNEIVTITSSSLTETKGAVQYGKTLTFTSGLIDANGNIISPTAHAEVYSEKIYCPYKVNATITFSAAQVLWVVVAEYEEDGTFIGRTTIISASSSASKSGSKTMSENCAYIRICLATYGNSYQFDNEIFIDSNKTFAIPYGEQADIKNNVLEIKSEVIKQGNMPYRVANHRGWNSVAPENTLPAFALSKQNGFEYVETDIRFSADDVPVMIHDATVDRTSNGSGNVVDKTLAQLKALDFGSWKSAEWAGTTIPTFDEFVNLCKNLDLKMYIELKTSLTSSEAQSVLDILNKYNMKNKCTFITSGASWIDELLILDNEFRIGFVGNGSSYSNRITQMVDRQAEGFKNFLDWKSTDITSQMITDTLAAGLEMETWTVDSATDIINLDSRISGVTTNNIKVEEAWINYYTNN